MKKFQLAIEKPCDANLQEMQKTNDGFFCTMCTKVVVDLSNLSQYEISKFISENRNNSICARMKTTQLDVEFDLIEQAKINRSFKYAAVAASVLAVSNLQAQDTKLSHDTQTEQTSCKTNIKGKIAIKKPEQNSEYSFVFYGKIINKDTKKPLSLKDYKDLQLSITYGSDVKYDAKTGNFSIKMLAPKDCKNLDIWIYNQDKNWNEQIPFSAKNIKKGKYQHNILVSPKEFQNMHIAGGLGINYPIEKTEK